VVAVTAVRRVAKPDSAGGLLAVLEYLLVVARKRS
jgi:hypothetical protein